MIPSGKQRDPDRVMPGDGQIDLNSEIEVLKEIGYDGTISLELFNSEWWGQKPETTLKVGLDRMRRLVS